MPQYVIILTEDPTNKSVHLLAASLGRAFKKVSPPVHVLVLCGNDAYVQDGNLIVPGLKDLLGKRKIINIPIDEILLVMKRTWTENRYHIWKICQALIEKQVPVINGQLIPWTHSKIAQYRTLALQSAFPKSICLDEQWMQSVQQPGVDLTPIIQDLLTQVETLGYPVVIKTSHGSRGTGVYRARDHEGLFAFLQDFLSGTIVTPQTVKKNGFMIQRYIPGSADYDVNRSIYWRVNVVNQTISSVVQFELGWEPCVYNGQSCAYERIHDKIKQPQDRPVIFNEAQENWIDNVIKAMPFPLEVVGLDVMFDSGQGLLLEVNDGPIVSLVEALGKAHEDTVAGKQCMRFSTDVATFSLQKVHHLSPHLQFKSQL